MPSERLPSPSPSHRFWSHAYHCGGRGRGHRRWPDHTTCLHSRDRAQHLIEAQDRPLDSDFWLLTGMFGIFLPILSTAAYSQAKAEQRDSSGDAVLCAKGCAFLEINKSDEFTSYSVTIQDNKRFTVKPHVFHAFEQGRNYAVYYAPHSGDMLSAEPLLEA